jgi:hypothetical protein
MASVSGTETASGLRRHVFGRLHRNEAQCLDRLNWTLRDGGIQRLEESVAHAPGSIEGDSQAIPWGTIGVHGGLNPEQKIESIVRHNSSE